MDSADDIVFLSAGGFPQGLSCSTAGSVLGTPVLAGTNMVMLVVEDSLGASTNKDLEIVIVPNPNTRPVIGATDPLEWSSAAAYVKESYDALTDLNPYIGADRWLSSDRQMYAEALQGSDDDEWMQKRSRKGYLGGADFPRQLKKEGGRYRRRRGRPGECAPKARVS